MGMGLDEAKDKAMQVKLSGEAMNEAFAQSFGDIIRGTESAKDALKNFFQFILDEILKLTVLNPLKDMFGDMWGDFAKSFGAGGDGALTGYDGNPLGGGGNGAGLPGSPNAHGNAYGSNGRITAFAKGGVVGSPTLFNYAGGRGLMGEAGAEAIMPLKRDSKGNLGVASEGGQSKVVNVTMNIVTKDADSFRRSRTQISNDMRQGAGQVGG
jgi:phage-related minor tail protein